MSTAAYLDLRIELALGQLEPFLTREAPAATSLGARSGTSRRGTRKAFHPGTGTRARHRGRRDRTKPGDGRPEPASAASWCPCHIRDPLARLRACFRPVP